MPMVTALTICQRCLDRARGIITDIRDLLAATPDTTRALLGLRAIRYDRSSPAAADDSRLPFGLDLLYDAIDVPGPAGVRTRAGALGLLEAWAQDWAERGGDHGGVEHTLDYLESHTLWAAQNHPAWADYLAEARATRALVRRLTGMEPEREPAPCVHCGGVIVHAWTPGGYDDTARCTRCHRTWPTRQALAFVNRYHIRALPNHAPDTLVTRDEARLVFPDLPAATLRLWIHRGLPVHGRDERGQAWYRVGDIAERIRTGAV